MERPQVRTKVVRKGSVGSKILMFFLGFLFGIVALAGGIVGAGFWAYKNLNLNVLDGWGVKVGDTVIASDSPLRTLTPELLLREIAQMTQEAQESTLSALTEKYKITIPESVKKYIPEPAMHIPVKQLFSAEGLNRVLRETDGQYLLQVAGMTDPLLVKMLSGKKLSVFLSGDMAQIMTGLYVGDLMGYKQVSATAAAWQDASGNEVSSLMGKLADVPVSDLMGGGFDIASLMTDVKLGDVIQVEGEVPAILRALGMDTPVTEVAKKIDSLLIGEILGYHRRQAVSPDGSPSVDAQGNPVYEQADGQDLWFETIASEGGTTTERPASGVMAGFVNLTIKDLQNPDAVQGKVNEMTLGDVMTIDESSNAILRALKETKIKDLSASVSTITIATVMELERKEDGWYMKKPPYTKASGIVAAFAGLTVQQLSDGTSVDNCVKNLSLGEIMSITDTSPAILKSLKDAKLTDFETRVNDLYLGEVMDLSRKTGADGQYETDPSDPTVFLWYEKGSDVAVTGVSAVLANLKVSETNAAKLKESVEKLKITDLFTETDTGIFSLLQNKNITITDLPNQLARDIPLAKMKALKEAGIVSASMVSSLESISKAIYYNNQTVSSELAVKDESGAAVAPIDCWQYQTMEQFFTKISAYLAVLSPAA